MLIKCVECDDDDGDSHHKGKSYCGDCFRAVRKLEANQQKETWFMGMKTFKITTATTTEFKQFRLRQYLF